MKKIGAFVFILFLVTPAFGKIRGSFPDLKNPVEFFIEGDRIYINEGEFISIYSLKDLKRIKTFGQKGEGPQEFQLNEGTDSVQLFVLDDCLQVNSIARMSFFTRDGEFIRMQRSLEGNYLYKVGKNFVGWKRVYQDKTRYDTVNVYDADLNLKIELYRQVNGIQPQHQRINPLTWFIDNLHRGYKEKIYICTLEGELMVFDNEGKKLTAFTLPLGKLTITRASQKEIMEFYSRKDPYWRQRFPRLKTWFRMPDTFPPVRYMVIVDDRIYILTYLEKNETTQCAIFDLNGKPVKKTFLPLVKESYLFYKPFNIKNNTLRQMVENEDTDEWELQEYEIN